MQEHVAVWAMDAAHYEILQNATQGKARTIWGYMDQQFSDQVSTVPFPSPVPPDIRVRLCQHRSFTMHLQLSGRIVACSEDLCYLSAVSELATTVLLPSSETRAGKRRWKTEIGTEYT